MSTIIITVDLGHFKAYRISQTLLGKSKTQLAKCYDSIEAHARFILEIIGQGESDR